jgi:predicted exporter
VWSPLVSLFVSPDADFAVTHVFYHIAKEDFPGLEGDWNALNCDVGNDKQTSDGKCTGSTAPARPKTIESVNLVGTQDTFYLFVKFGLPWLDYVSYIAAGLTFLIALVVLRKPRDVLAVMVPMIVATVWWTGLLPLFGIQKSMTLMLPTVMLISVGSDYAIQYVWNYRELGDMEEVYRTTGKANLYVVIATIIAFLLFVPMQLVLSSQGALAAALAIACIFVSTTLLVPLFYPGAGQTDRVVVTQVEEESVPVGVSR